MTNDLSKRCGSYKDNLLLLLGLKFVKECWKPQVADKNLEILLKYIYKMVVKVIKIVYFLRRFNSALQKGRNTVICSSRNGWVGNPV